MKRLVYILVIFFACFIGVHNVDALWTKTDRKCISEIKHVAYDDYNIDGDASTRIIESTPNRNAKWVQAYIAETGYEFCEDLSVYESFPINDTVEVVYYDREHKYKYDCGKFLWWETCSDTSFWVKIVPVYKLKLTNTCGSKVDCNSESQLYAKAKELLNKEQKKDTLEDPEYKKYPYSLETYLKSHKMYMPGKNEDPSAEAEYINNYIEYYKGKCCKTVKPVEPVEPEQPTKCRDTIAGVGTCTGTNHGAAYYYDFPTNYTNDTEYVNKCVVNDEKYKDYNLSNEYCSVYCSENLRTSRFYNSNGDAPAVAGRYVDLSKTSGILATVEGTRTCYTVVNKEKIKQAVDAKNEEISAAYLAYLLEVAKEREIASGYDKVESGQGCDCKYSATIDGTNLKFECCNKAEFVSVGTCTSETTYVDMGHNENGQWVPNGKYIEGNRTDGCKNYRNKSNYILSCSTTDNSNNPTFSGATVSYISTETCEIKEAKCTIDNRTRYDYYKYDTSVNLNTASGTKSDTWSANRCDNEPAPTADATAAFRDYMNVVNNARRFVENLTDICYFDSEDSANSIDKLLYNLDPNFSLSYSDGKEGGYYYNSELIGRIDESVSKRGSVIYDGDASKTQGDAPKAIIENCSGNACTIDNTSSHYFPLHDMSQISKTTKIDYILPDNIYGYISKTSGKSTMDMPSGSYVKIGANLPISYNANNDYNYITINYDHLGHTSSSGVSRVDNYLKQKSSNYGEWSCDFDIKDSLVTENGLNVIYRTIDLTNPFPGINGTGRKTGSNWCYNDDCGSGNQLVQDVIISKSNVYSKIPMYSFILTPNTISKIRNYNKNREYSDYDLKCDENGNACVSSFITWLSENTTATGKCMIGQVRTNNFYNCQP